ncbi:MAG: hypothetical protein P1U80_08415 [Pseudomonadales bacterium]|nr:hypothetical protein [Pseudomonadales bacterium]
MSLVLAQAAWASDVFRTLKEESILGTVLKTRVFHSELLNLANNHRMMIRNAKLRD